MAEINYNNLYNTLNPMDRRYYDQQFSKNYVPGQENIMLSSQPAYEQMKAVYEAQQQVPEKGFFDFLNFGEASAAEMPQVPNLSLGYNMPTFDLGTGKGITNTSSALPFRSMVDMQEAANQDLVQQIIAENQARTNPFVRPNMLDIAGGVVPGGIPTASSVTPSIIPENLLYEDFNYKYLPSANDQYESEATTTPQTKKDGIAGLLKFLVGLAVPGAGFLMNLPGKGLEGIRSLNQRIQGSDFGQATSLMDYLDMRKYGGLQGRRDAAARTMAQARGIQKKIDTGKYRRTAADNVIDRGRGDRPGGANYTAPSKPSRTSPQSGMQAERTRSRDLGSMRGGVGR